VVDRFGGVARERGIDLIAINPKSMTTEEFDALLPGDTFSEDGAFKLTVLSHTDTHVDVQFAWTDTTPPKPPGVLEPRGTIRTTGTRRLPVSWNPAAEDGSGVARYEVTLDGAPPRIVDADFRIGDHASLGRLAYGRHGIRVLAIDRAGNRGPATLSRFTIAKPVSGKHR